MGIPVDQSPGFDMQSDIFFGLTEGMIQVVRNWMQVGNSGVVLGYLEDTFFWGGFLGEKWRM